MRQNFEYALVWLFVRVLGALPRSLSRALGIGVGMAAYLIVGRLRRVGIRNLEIAFPELQKRQRSRILRELFVGFGRQLSEFCMFPRYTRENARHVALYDGFENYAAARDAGRGVLLLTAHLGAWEIGSFVHSIFGAPRAIAQDIGSRSPGSRD